MPLSEKARIEIYLPDLLAPSYRNLLESLEQEFTYTFGGCATVHGLSGHYLSEIGSTIPDRMSLLYTDAAIAFDENMATLSRYTERLRLAAFQALEEEAVLVAAFKVYHAEKAPD